MAVPCVEEKGNASKLAWISSRRAIGQCVYLSAEQVRLKMDNLERTNRALFGYLGSHGRLPQKGLLRKRQFTWDEMVSYAKEQIDWICEEKRVQEYLGIFLRLTFSVDGWWRDREPKLLSSGRWGEVVALNQLFKQHPWFSATKLGLDSDSRGEQRS